MTFLQQTVIAITLLRSNACARADGPLNQRIRDGKDSGTVPFAPILPGEKHS